MKMVRMLPRRLDVNLCKIAISLIDSLMNAMSVAAIASCLPVITD
jgi:hypothetical protein